MQPIAMSSSMVVSAHRGMVGSKASNQQREITLDGMKERITPRGLPLRYRDGTWTPCTEGGASGHTVCLPSGLGEGCNSRGDKETLTQEEVVGGADEVLGDHSEGQAR